MSTGTMYQARVLEEVTYGVLPTAAAQVVNVSGFPIQLDRTGTKPNVFTGDRRTHKMRRTREQSTLSAGAPFQWKNLLLFLEGLLYSDVEAPVTISDTTGDIDFNGTTGEVTSTVTDFVSSGIKNGDLIFISQTVDNNGWKGPVTQVQANSFFLPAGQVTTETPTNCDIDTERLVDANVDKSYHLEWEDTALTNKFTRAGGMYVTQGVWRFEQGSLVQETFTLAGQAPTQETATIDTGGPLAAPTTDVMNAVQDWGTLYIAEAATTAVVSSLTLTIAQVAQPTFGLGSLGPAAVTMGNYTVTLEASVLFDDNSASLVSDIENENTVTIWWDLVDVQGNRVAFFLPAGAAGGEIPQPDDAGTLVDFTLRVDGHDPDKDNASAYNGAGFDFQQAVYFKAA